VKSQVGVSHGPGVAESFGLSTRQAAMTSEFEIIDRVVGVADEKRAKRGVSALSTAERVASDIWSASGIIGNGSFQYFFECGLDAENCARAYEAIGMPEAARIFRLALSLFPDSHPHEDFAERVAFIREREDAFDKLGMEIVRLDSKMEALLSAYLKNAGLE